MFLSFESTMLVGVLPLGVITFWGFLYFVYSAGGGTYRHLVGLVVSQFGYVFFPFSMILVGVFFCVLLMNCFGLVPLSLAISSWGALTLSWALVFWLGNYIFCLGKEFVYNVAHFLPVGTPGFLMVFLVWIEVVSWLARPIALGVRLMANITAGHLLLHLLSEGVSLMGGGALVVVGVGGLFLMGVLEVAVAFIQAYVFSLLLSLYVSEGLGR
uniref:ATP synthase subunit a n=1 Tax=Phallusia fumigata TaxID=395376 RepID=A7WL87_9ASCI|nr:ATP synthase F0 subunit 6 [Phallusia fumigata]CAL24355.1 ATPase subunit 6 [Phallusia fumigata]